MSKLSVENNEKINVNIQAKDDEAVALLAIATKAVAVKIKMKPLDVIDIVKNALIDAKAI